MATEAEVLAAGPGPTPCSGAPSTGMKITDLLKMDLPTKGMEQSKTQSAFEYFPPRTADGVTNLYKRFGRMAERRPLYMDMTWGAGGSTSDLTLDLCRNAKERYGMEPNMHLTCTNMEVEKIKQGLDGAKAAGIRNIVALRGDPPAGQDRWEATEGGFACALDLVKHIRENYGDWFCVSVAGYPEGHPNVIKEVGDAPLSAAEQKRVVFTDDGQFVCHDADYAAELAYLKAKVDAGADFVITQMFFDVEVYVQFVADCRAAGIGCPIVPGIMMLSKYPGFKRMTTLCKTRVPPHIMARADSIKDDAAAVAAYGVELATEMSTRLLAVGAPVLHYYSLNMDNPTLQVLDNLVELEKSAQKSTKSFATTTTVTHPDGTVVTVTTTNSA